LFPSAEANCCRKISLRQGASAAWLECVRLAVSDGALTAKQERVNPVFELVKYSLADRSSTSQPNGLSCDHVPIAPRVRNPDGSLSYQLRNLDEINLILSAAYAVEIDVAGKANHLRLVTR
jgi:hypothetical protein